ncbi:signal recognition particle 19 kDa protein isoform X2 [Mustela nigripes]|uniref:signal recognition particle 19 kDa protein isoform X2 n=1 Tax=Mustela nigripes TaxID=77151 RepID=UPI0028165E79|nr:signal recognition particle 19 kDa protein isoform X2 [Mustela nigripes]
MACAAARSPADQDRFICIYPAYLNNKKTIAEGRRIPISKAVENPTATEIQDVCSAVGLNVFLEKNKMYSREWNRDVQYRGRVRVQLKHEDGSLCLVQFPSQFLWKKEAYFLMDSGLLCHKLHEILYLPCV